MRKKWLPLLTLFCLSISCVGGCSSDNTSTVDRLTIDGEDVVLKVGDKTYKAVELFESLLKGEDGAQEIYEKVLKMVVNNTMSTSSDMETSWDLKLEAFEEDVEEYAASNSVSEKEARKTLLANEGYSSIDEMKEEYLYSVKLSKLEDKYWEDNKEELYEEYFEKMLPYYVQHVLVKTSYNTTRGAYANSIASTDATDLYEVYEMLKNGEKFNYIKNEKSEDTGSSNTKLGYYMDLTTSFVSEFLHGVFTFDALLKGKTSEVSGLTSEVLELYKSTNVSNEGYNFSYINASDIEALGKTASSTTDNNITIYKDVEDTENGGTKEESNGTIYSAFGSSTDLLYSRSMIFNQTFNNPGISVIVYDLDDDVASNTTTLNINGENKKVLTDEKGNIVFVVCAKGSSSDLWVHFLTVNVSPFDENAKLFFSLDKENTIEKMVDAKKDELDETALASYRESLEKYQTYVELKGGTTQTGQNTVIAELEDYAKTYAKGGTTATSSSGGVDGSDDLLQYKMLKHYMTKGNISITTSSSDDDVKKVVSLINETLNNYIDGKINLANYNIDSYINSSWKDYYNEVSLAHSSEIVDRKIPLECSYAANGDSDSLCKYKYGEGYYIKVTLDYDSGKLKDGVTFADYYQIGDGVVTLPTQVEREGHTFLGWYTSKDDDGVKVETIDFSRTSTKNKTKLYAKWEANE